VQDVVETFIRSGGTEGCFDRLALDLFAYQCETVPAYRRLCENRGIAPASVSTWHDIPCAPVEIFREDLHLPGERPHAFLSSGTTDGDQYRSKHELRSLETYRSSSLKHFQTMVMPDEPGTMSVLVLGPTAETYPASSLGHMFSWLLETSSDRNVLVAFRNGTVDLEGALTWLAEAAAGSTPVLILAVTSAITAVLDEIRRRGRDLRLPADSRVVDTGGNKSYGRAGQRARAYSPRALLKAAWSRLHVPGYLCVNEYGMTEMLSQFYDDALVSRVRGDLVARSKIGPAWVRSSIVDPATLAPVTAGEPGFLRHVDLANWDSIAFLQTHDVARAVGNGFEVLGRAPGARPRGCSALAQNVTDDPGAGDDA
jgi:hypothetical protein